MKDVPGKAATSREAVRPDIRGWPIRWFVATQRRELEQPGPRVKTGAVRFQWAMSEIPNCPAGFSRSRTAVDIVT